MYFRETETVSNFDFFLEWPIAVTFVAVKNEYLINPKVFYLKSQLHERNGQIHNHSLFQIFLSDVEHSLISLERLHSTYFIILGKLML